VPRYGKLKPTLKAAELTWKPWAQIASLPGGTSATTTADPAYARQAGIPLASSYAPPAAPARQAGGDANPCLGEDAGFTTGLAAAFASGSPGLDFAGNGSFQRCALRARSSANL